MKITVSADEVRTFASGWPCAHFPDEEITFEFASNGDLVDMHPADWEERGADGYALSCLSHDAQSGQVGVRS